MSQSKPEEDDRERLLHHIFVLLDHLERQSDNRLQAHFKDIRSKLSANSTIVARPPCDTYVEFLARVTEIRQKSCGTSNLEDERFLRWSRDFLAAVAAPSTVETISITREYIRTRTEWALNRWREWLRPRGASTRERRARNAIEDEGFRDSAHWLARTVRRVEGCIVLVMIIALVLSAHAMVGRLIISQEKDALVRYQELTKSADAERLGLFRVAGASTFVRLTDPDHGCPAEYNQTEQVEPKYDLTFATMNDGQREWGRFGKPTGAANPSATAQEAAWNLVEKCRGVQWALMQLVTENVRLKSWDGPYIQYVPWLIGWDQRMVKSVGSVLKDDFCEQVAKSYHENFGAGCRKIFNLLVRDSSSVASSVLGCLTMYILPCLYAFIGAATAAMLGIRRKTDASLLSYSDRGRVKQAIVLGFVFGGVIGLFAGYLSRPLETNGLGLSALALLAGYNVPAVSEFLEELSKRIFRPAERSAPSARAT
jgi:hypothetical protein